MQVTGHSRQMFDRYNVTSERDLELAVEAVSATRNWGLTRHPEMEQSSTTVEDTQKFIKRIRRELGASYADIASMLGVTEKAVRSWESGDRIMGEPSRRLLILLAEKRLAEAKA